MKLILLMVTQAMITLSINAQSVVRWEFSSKKLNAKTYEIHFTPMVQSPWHIYSQTSPEGGAKPTKFSFNKNPLTDFDETKIKEVGKIITKYEEVFDVDVKYFEGKIDFVLVVKIKNKVRTNVSGMVEFMACNDVKCLAPTTVPFNIQIGSD